MHDYTCLSIYRSIYLPIHQSIYTCPVSHVYMLGVSRSRQTAGAKFALLIVGDNFLASIQQGQSAERLAEAASRHKGLIQGAALERPQRVLYEISIFTYFLKLPLL